MSGNIRDRDRGVVHTPPHPKEKQSFAAPPRHNLRAQVKKLGADSLLPRGTRHVRRVADELVAAGLRGKAKRLRKAATLIDAEWADYEVRTGGDNKPGIYLRHWNVRLATFNANTTALQGRLAALFDGAAAPPKPKRKKRSHKRRMDYSGPGGGAFMSDVFGDF